MIAVVVGVILIWVVAEDIRHFRVRNAAVLALALCFPLDCLVRGRLFLIAPHLALAAACFILLAAAFFVGAVGGGDAKLLAAAILWVGPEGCFVFAVLLLACTLLYVLAGWFGWLPTRKVRGRTVMPFGPSIAVAWIATMVLVALL